MVHAENAMEQMRDIFDRLSVQYSVKNLGEDKVQLTVEKNGIVIETWFDVDKQVYGFDMLNGLSKSYDSADKFESLLGSYLMIHTQFLPSAKIIASAFEKTQNIQTTYDNFSGNQQSGFVAKFKLSTDEMKGVLVQKCPVGYSAKLIEYSPDFSKYRTLVEYTYEFDDNNELSLVPNIYSYIDRLYGDYENDENIDISRDEVSTFTFGIADLTVTAEVTFMYKSIKYVVQSINGEPCGQTFELQDAFNLSELHKVCMRWLKGETEPEESVSEPQEEIVENDGSQDETLVEEPIQPEEVEESSLPAENLGDSEVSEEPVQEETLEEDAGVAEETEKVEEESMSEINEEVTVEETPVESEELTEDVQGEDIAENDAEETSVESDASGEELSEEAPAEEVAQEETSVEESVAEETSVEKSAEEAVDESQSEEESISKMNIEVKSSSETFVPTEGEVNVKVVVRDGEDIYLQFISESEICNILTEKAKAMNVPLYMVHEEVNLINSHGIWISEDEKNLRRFAKDVTSDDAKCEELIGKLFD